VGADANYIQSLSSTSLLPNDVKFLAGGQNLRGYGYNTVGLPASVCVPGSTANACVVGGTVMLLGHAEVRVPIWGELGGVVFTDAGNVWATPADVGLGNIKLTTGLGLRYLTPVGPVRVDYGVRVLPGFQFTGWEGLTFGIGQAF
jgi:outer membrane translocation and assembly module TamA